MGMTTTTPITVETKTLQTVFTENLKMGVPFRDCFMLVLGLSGHTQASLMRCVNRTQVELSQYLNGHRGFDAPVHRDLKKACHDELGFNPWDYSDLEQSGHE